MLSIKALRYMCTDIGLCNTIFPIIFNIKPHLINEAVLYFWVYIDIRS